MNIHLARFNMVQQQVRTWDVSDQKILDLLTLVPRENFVPKPYHNIALSDSFIPIGQNQVTLTPKLIGRMLQALAITQQDIVLEIGTGTGYVTALLANLANQIWSIEIFQELKETATSCLKSLHLNNIQLVHGDAFIEFDRFSTSEFAKKNFDIIIFTGSVPKLDNKFLELLTLGGRLFAFVGTWPILSALLITRTEQAEWTTQKLFENYIPPLIMPHPEHSFQF